MDGDRQVTCDLPLVVMYHYVWRNDQPAPGGIRPLLASEFEGQLDWLQANYSILPPGVFLDLLERNEWGERPPCLLTFDDGTRDHAEVVTPILRRRKLSGVFFVSTWPMELGRMPLSHAIHWLLGKDEQQVWRDFEKAAREELGSTEALGSEQEARRIYHYETPLRARIKFAANMALPDDLASRIVMRSILAHGEDPAALAKRWFVSAGDVVKMRNSGMTIGLHGCSHRTLQVLGPQGIRQEIAHSSSFIRSLLHEPPTWFACPFGGSGASQEAVAAMHEAMREFGIRASVSTERTLVPRRCDAWRLPRIDAADLPPRKPFAAPARNLSRITGGSSGCPDPPGPDRISP